MIWERPNTRSYSVSELQSVSLTVQSVVQNTRSVSLTVQPRAPTPLWHNAKNIYIFIFLLVKYGKIIHFYLFYLPACLPPPFPPLE